MPNYTKWRLIIAGALLKMVLIKRVLLRIQKYRQYRLKDDVEAKLAEAAHGQISE